MNNQDPELARLFFGAQVEAPWPKDYPAGRLIPEETRHVTLAFLGQGSASKLLQILPSFPRPPFQIGPAGIGKELVFLPPDHSRTVSLFVQWLDSPSVFNSWQQALTHWLMEHGYRVDERPFFPHLTVARSPFDKKAWQEHFTPLPLFVKAIHLYQSKGNLDYESLWEIPLLAPFEEFEHTADIAYHIRGSTPQQLHQHAQLALAFKFPPLVAFFSQNLQDSLEEIVISLNELVAQADQEYGCPLKAVSFHGNIHEDQQHLLHWEMIVDV
jgi:RNA 2',3'-cyclic 3'-phosphodiesterase